MLSFSLDSINISLSLDTCFRRAFPSGLTPPMRREETRSQFWCPQDLRAIMHTQECPAMRALVLEGRGRGSPGRGKAACVNVQGNSCPYTSSSATRTLSGLNSSSLKSSFPQTTGHHGQSQGHRGGHGPTTSMSSPSLSACNVLPLPAPGLERCSHRLPPPLDLG